MNHISLSRSKKILSVGMLALLLVSCTHINQDTVKRAAQPSANICASGAALVNPLALAPGMGGTGLAPQNKAEPGGIGGTGNLPQSPGIGGTGAVAQSPGIGGTGAIAQSPGIGGTGAVAQSPGIGGTGAVAQSPGIGGTGIVGVVTGFASICVNGVEVHFDNSTPVSVDGHPHTG